MTGDVQLVSTAHQSNYSQTNIGYANSGQIDAFHRVSVPYVVSLLECDMTTTIGGELQLIERDPDEDFRLMKQYQGKLPKDFIQTTDYLGSNSCVFMQDSIRRLFFRKK
ncbi:hypothetical protein I4U23_026973 [Adineta vaga]|nr:hypothetical protein I4U23_026973 [Adineta vaga]